MPTFWVSYAIIDGPNGQTGTGACDVTMPGTPGSVDEVNRLADLITDTNRDRGALRRDQWVTVQGWSRMGE
jgi:hypothetical protein